VSRSGSTPSWRRYLRFWGHDPARDLDDELRFHLEARYDEYIAAGMNPAAARSEAERRFGSVDAVRDQCVAIDSQWERSRTMADMFHILVADLRYAVRQLRRNPSLSIAAILCFALGIGANTSIFSVVDAVLFRPLPFPDADRLVLIGEALPRFGGANMGSISSAEYLDYKQLDGRIFKRSAIYDNGSFVLSGNAEPERIYGAVASASLFDVLQVKAAHGRTFLPNEDQMGAPDVVVISDPLWRRRFDADPAIVGRSITLDGRRFTIIGVMPPGFAFPLPGIGKRVAELFAPYVITPDEERLRGNVYNTHFVARLAPGVTIDAAHAAAQAIARRLPELHPGVYGRSSITLAEVFSLRERAVGDVRRSLLVLLAAVALVLLIACINVSSLLLARAATRHRELSVRRALGASRGRLVQQFLSETLVLIVSGGTLGIALAVWGSRLLATKAPQSLLQGYNIAVDGRVLLVTAFVAIATAIAISMLPAWQQSDGALASTLREEGRGASGGIARQRGRRTLVVSQIALALVLASGAGLMVRSLINARNVDPGFKSDGLVAFRLRLPDYRYRTANDVQRTESAVLDRLRALPGVASVTAATTVPMSGIGWHIAVSMEGIPLDKAPIVSNTLVFPDYFATMRIPVRAGEAFTGRETSSSPRVAIVNETFARTFYPGTSPIGRRIKWGSPTSPSPWATIVGVSADVKGTSLDAPQEPATYFVAAQQDSLLVTGALRDMAYVVRAAGDPYALVNPIRRAVREIDPAVPVVDLRSVGETVDLSVSTRRFNTMLLAAFAVLALVLAAVGLYGLMAYTVVQRTREIGIRLAIGATSADVLGLVVGQAARIAAAGVTIGLAGALGLTRIMRTLLFGISPLDAPTFVMAAALLFGIAALASYLPARRAAHIDPQSAIRAD
jgi:predicted permease